MSSIAPVGPASDNSPLERREEPQRIEPEQPESTGEKSPAAVKADGVKQAEKTTLNDFQYTGKGSFIDKVF